MNAVVELDVESARRLTEHIRLTAMRVGEDIDKLKVLVKQARESEAHIALGYASWTAYLADVLGETPMRLEREVRQALVAELSEQGMSTRAIAPIVGVGDSTVQRDLARAPHGAPVLSDEPGHVTKLTGTGSVAAVNVTPTLPPRMDDWVQPGELVDTVTGEVTDVPVTVTETHTIKTVTGLDGKTYSAPATPRPAPRRALTKQFFDAAYDLQKVIARLERLASDDRFSTNKGQIASDSGSSLARSASTLAGVLNKVTN